jgi:hypothetical protein
MTYQNVHIGEDRRLEAGQAKSHGHGDSYHILAASSLADERTQVLKHGDTFAAFDHCGDMKDGGLGEEGLGHKDTHDLSCLWGYLAYQREKSHLYEIMMQRSFLLTPF